MRYIARIGDEEFALEVVRRGGGRYAVRLNGKKRDVEKRGSGVAAALAVDGHLCDASISRDAGSGGRTAERSYGVTIDGRLYPVRILDPLRRTSGSAGLTHQGKAEVRATMPGRITSVLVKEGAEVKSGQGLLVVEAMKMENEIPSPRQGRVSGIKVSPGDAVEAGALLATIE